MTTTDCCIVGAGPAGSVLALLLARQGVHVTLLEAHTDFERDFRGDALQPAALDVIGQLGLADALLERALSTHATFPLHTPTGTLEFLNVSQLQTPYPFIAMVPQARFLELVIAEADRLPTFNRIMGARVESLLRNSRETITGVTYRAADNTAHGLEAQVVVAADGRFSRTRSLANLDLIQHPSPYDLLWFRLPRQPTDRGGGVYLGRSGWLVLLNRGTEWQVAYSLPKNVYARLRSEPPSQLQHLMADCVPWLADRAGGLTDWRQTSLLAIEVNRLRRWHRPGLLVIGDAAHTMSPVAGVGISVALQDAVVAANILGRRFVHRQPIRNADLARVQRQREWPVRIVQAYQGAAHRWLAACRDGRAPLALRAQARVAPMRALAARVFGLGVWPVRAQSANACMTSVANKRMDSRLSSSVMSPH
ncbi:MAG TPA: FAD-dependent oxidoreductase [Chloroflexota bacterium]|jgi:2-polyprenyl-6-methoxyphenol hydroxylase-like FAD-dependent oxidoreductase